MTGESTGTVAQAMAYFQAQAAHPDHSWEDRCLELQRTAWAIPPLNPTAYAAYLTVDPAHLHKGGSPDDAPVGAFLFSKGSNPAGHIWDAARPFPSGATAGWSNDLLTVGAVDKVHRNAPMTKWGHSWLGWSDEVNGYVIDLTKPASKPVAKHQRRYLAVKHAIERLEEQMQTLHGVDHKQAAKDIERLKKLYADLRGAGA